VSKELDAPEFFIRNGPGEFARANNRLEDKGQNISISSGQPSQKTKGAIGRVEANTKQYKNGELQEADYIRAVNKDFHFRPAPERKKLSNIFNG
ncbi:MAG: hypothetical protein AAF585_25205, partial [Verrucomicrobiota bacterium]